MKRIISFLIILILTVVPFNTAKSNAESEPIFGIDVSRWQEEIDWVKVKNDNVNFAIIRAHSNGEDIYFQENYAGAIAAGLDVGAYSYTYATSIDEATKEANDLVSILGKRKFQYPIFIDIEDPSYYSISKDLTTQILLTQLEILRDAGYYAAIYSGVSFAENQLDLSLLSDYDMWIAHYSSSCGYSHEYTMWQYSDSGSVNGISGPVDTDYCYVDYPKIIAESGLNFLKENSMYPSVGTVTADVLNIRNKPSTSGDVVTQIPQDTNVTVNGVEGISGWYYISFTDANNNYYTGYCSNDYINIKNAYNILGDVDLSGSIDATDALIVLQHSVGKIALTSDALKCADVDRNDNVSANDALLILQYSVGKITIFN